jgi:hypothetical protein
VPIIDDRTGAVAREWYRWFYSLYNIVGAGTGIIPVDSGGTGLNTIPTNGQLLIGNGTGYALNTLSTGSGISVTNGAGTISIANTGVLSNIAGLGIGVSSATGDVTISNTGVLSFSGGTTGLTPIAAATGVVTLAGTLAIANGGTNGSATPTAYGVAYGTGTAYAFTAAGTTGQVLTATTSAAPTWTTISTGTVTSVGLSAPAIFTVTGSPVTTSGTLTLAYSGTALPTTSGGTGLTSFTASGVVYASSTSVLATGSALTFNGTNLTTTGSTTAARFIPTSTTAPTTGIYLKNSTGLAFSGGTGTALVTIGIYGLSVGTTLSGSNNALLEVNSTNSIISSGVPTATNGIGIYNSGGTWAPGYALISNINVNSLRSTTIDLYDGLDTGSITTATTLYIEGSPVGSGNGTGTVITNPYSLYIASGASYFGGAVTLNTTSTHNGTATFANTTGNKLVVSGNISQAAWTTTGPAISVATGTYTSSAGLTGTVAANSLGTPTFAATTASQTVTNAATLYIAAAPSNGTNVTITNAFALYVAAGKTSLTGNLLLNTTATYPSVAATTAITPQFQLSGTTASTASKGQFGWNTTPYYTFNRSNGAVGVYTAVTSGVGLGAIQFNGADGTTFVGSSTIIGSADAAVSAGIVPGRLTFSTADSAGTLTERLRFTSAGGISFGSSGTAYGTTGQLLTSAGNSAPTWTSVTGSGNIVSATSPTITNLTLAAGTASLAPLVMTSGTSLTSPVAGAIEFDGSTFFSTDDVTDGRGFIPSAHFYRLTADGSAITTIANFFGATSGTALDNNIFYEVEAYLYFLKTTSGTATFTMTFSNAPVNNNAFYVGSQATAVGAVGTPQTAALIKSTATAGALPATNALTSAGNHQYVLRAMFQANATTGGTINLQVTSSAGSITPLTGSYYKITRLPAANTGAYV